MNPNDKSNDKKLDALLTQARWTQAPAESLQHLERQWRRTRRPKYLLKISAAAAIILVCLGIFWSSIMLSIKPVSSKLNMFSNTESDNIDQAAVNLISREPTLIEKFLITTAIKEAKKIKDIERTTNLQKHVLDAINDLAASETTNPMDIATELVKAAEPRHIERIVISQPKNENKGMYRASLQLLALVGTRRSLPLLLSAYENPDLKNIAMPGILRLANSGLLVKLARREREPLILRHLLAQYLRTHHKSLDVYLNFVKDPETTEIALSAIEDVTEPPIRQLFISLNKPDLELRLAAAKALGRLDRPEVIRRLVFMVEKNVNRRSAIMVLLYNRTDAGKRLIAAIKKHPSLSLTLKSVESKITHKT